MRSRYYLSTAIKGKKKIRVYSIINFAIDDAEKIVNSLEDWEKWYESDFSDTEIWRKENDKGDYVIVEHKKIS